MNRALVAAVAFALIVSFAAGFFVNAVTQHSRRVGNRAAVKAVGVEIYQDASLMVELVEIDWGVLEPGESHNHTAYVANEGNAPITLSLATENWSPVVAALYLTLTWDYDGGFLEVSRSVEVMFTLALDPAVSGIDSFTFDLVVVGSG